MQAGLQFEEKPLKTPQRQRNQRGEGGRLKAEILEAAMRILDRTPAATLSLRMVAREAGVAAPSVYAHFANVDALMSEIVRECWRQLGEEMGADAEQPDTTNGLTALKTQMKAYVRYAMERPSRYQLLFALQPMAIDAWRDLPGPIQPAYRAVLASVDRLAKAGTALPMSDAMASTLLVLSIAHGRIALAHTAPHRRGNSVVGVSTFVMHALDRAFGA